MYIGIDRKALIGVPVSGVKAADTIKCWLDAELDSRIPKAYASPTPNEIETFHGVGQRNSAEMFRFYAD